VKDAYSLCGNLFNLPLFPGGGHKGNITRWISLLYKLSGEFDPIHTGHIYIRNNDVPAFIAAVAAFFLQKIPRIGIGTDRQAAAFQVELQGMTDTTLIIDNKHSHFHGLTS
jgi:hypothetical protein